MPQSVAWTRSVRSGTALDAPEEGREPPKIGGIMRRPANPVKVQSSGGRSWLPEPHILVRRREVEQRVQSDGGLLDPWAHPMQGRRLEDRRVHDPVVHESLDLV